MAEIHKAKFFKTGGSKALRIPATFFSGVEEVWMRWDDASQTLTISPTNPKPFEDFFKLAAEIGEIDIPDFVREPENESRPDFEQRMKGLWGE